MTSQRYQFPFKENYFETDGVRLHYVDEGSGPPLLLVHGNMESSYTYRKMNPPLVEAGYRCVAPDLLGFGLSDKPSAEEDYSLLRHVIYVTALVNHLWLEDVTTIGGDWGGPISLRYAIEHRDNVRALVILGTLVKTMGGLGLFGILFTNSTYSSFLIREWDLFRRMMLKKGFARPVDPQAMEEIKAAHPDKASRAGIAAFPRMIPMRRRHPYASYVSEIDEVLPTWDVPTLVMFADKDPAFKAKEGRRIASMVPDGRFHLVENASHFMPEDAGEEIASMMIAFLRDEAKVT